MTDTTLTDLDLFFERFDRRNRLVSIVALCASLALSGVILGRGVLMPAAPAAIRAIAWGLGVAFAPAFIVVWWGYTEHTARRRTLPRDGVFAANADDARNGVRVANAGFAFHLVVTATAVAAQALMAMLAFGFQAGDLIPRAICVAVGAVTIHLGNLWPRMPTSRTPEPAAARRMKANRLWGWVMVIGGVLVVLLGLIPPHLYPLPRR
jgi:hypothetical protein